jgi:hypothetical protein
MRPDDVRHQHFLKLLRRRLHSRFLEMDARVVHETRHRSDFARHPLGQRPRRLELRNIMHQITRPLPKRNHRRRQLRLTPPHEHHPRTRPGHAPGDRQPDAGAATGDQGNLVSKRKNISEM